MSYKTLAELALKTAKTYAVACGIGCKVVEKSGQLLASFSEQEGDGFCQLIMAKTGEFEQCRQSFLYGGYQAEKLGEYYIYFCPNGLVNWAVPVLNRGVAEYYLVGGPVLLHEIDELLLEDIHRQNPVLVASQDEIRKSLAKIAILSPTRVRYLAEILFKLARNLMQNDLDLLAERQKFSTLGAGIAEAIHERKAEPNGEEDCVFALEKDLVFAVQTGDGRGARGILNEILGALYFEDTSFEVKKSRLIALNAVLARAAIAAGADLEVIFGLENSYLNQIQDLTDLLELSRLLVPVLDRFIACTFVLGGVKNRDLIFKAISFIRNNYHCAVTLQDVALDVGLTPTYFSKLFKEETGLTYTDYLNRVRIEAAKLLIKEDRPLAEISQRVGFNDQSYFCKVFRRLQGQSPLQWRRADLS